MINISVLTNYIARWVSEQHTSFTPRLARTKKSLFSTGRNDMRIPKHFFIQRTSRKHIMFGVCVFTSSNNCEVLLRQLDEAYS